MIARINQITQTIHNSLTTSRQNTDPAPALAHPSFPGSGQVSGTSENVLTVADLRDQFARSIHIEDEIFHANFQNHFPDTENIQRLLEISSGQDVLRSIQTSNSLDISTFRSFLSSYYYDNQNSLIEILRLTSEHTLTRENLIALGSFITITSFLPESGDNLNDILNLLRRNIGDVIFTYASDSVSSTQGSAQIAINNIVEGTNIAEDAAAISTTTAAGLIFRRMN